MKRASIRTMSELNKSTKVAVPGEAMYLRLLTINYQKQVLLERVMAYENAAVPLSIFSDEGFMLSGKKSKFFYKLESLIPGNPIQQVSDGDAIIFDANAILHALRVTEKETWEVTYADMADSFLAYLLALSRKTCGIENSQIHAVFDRYVPNSTKAATCEKRAGGTIATKFHVTSEAPVPKVVPELG